MIGAIVIPAPRPIIRWAVVKVVDVAKVSLVVFAEVGAGTELVTTGPGDDLTLIFFKLLVNRCQSLLETIKPMFFFLV